MIGNTTEIGVKAGTGIDHSSLGVRGKESTRKATITRETGTEETEEGMIVETGETGGPIPQEEGDHLETAEEVRLIGEGEVQLGAGVEAGVGAEVIVERGRDLETRRGVKELTRRR
jgi:hypothetical protein